LKLALALCLIAGLAHAQEFIAAPGKLSDEDFYRIVACAAPPGGECQKRLVRWSKRDARDISVSIAQIDAGYPAKTADEVTATLDGTLDRLNASGARFRLTRAEAGERADIRIYLLDLPRDTPIRGTGVPWFDGEFMELARFQMEWNGSGHIQRCVIGFSRNIRPFEVQGVLNEEVAQCLGLMTDIGGRYYETRSIFSETGLTKNFGAQDIAALRRHYP
jgi:hypothetical protein